MADHDHEPDPDARVTSPMQEFTTRQALLGAVILVVGLVVAFGVPLIMTA